MLVSTFTPGKLSSAFPSDDYLSQKDGTFSLNLHKSKGMYSPLHEQLDSLEFTQTKPTS